MRRLFPSDYPALGLCGVLFVSVSGCSETVSEAVGFQAASPGGALPAAGVGGAAAGAGAPAVADVAGSAGLGGGLGIDGMTGSTAETPDAAVADAGLVAEPEAAVADTQDVPRPPCLKRGSQVVLLGDSYINWVSHSFPADLNAQAGETFRMYAVGATSMGSGGVGFIPPQLDQALADEPDITTIVMTGGGNDVLVPDTAQFPQGGDCKMSQSSATIPDCQKIVDTAIEAADDMMQNGIAKLPNKVTHVVYFFYPNVPEGTLVGGTYPNAILDYSAPLVKDFCDTAHERTNGQVVCHFVDLRPAFRGHPEYFAPTDIHPNLVGSQVMAKEVWKTMQDNCLAQPASSGCCEP